MATGPPFRLRRDWQRRSVFNPWAVEETYPGTEIDILGEMRDSPSMSQLSLLVVASWLGLTSMLLAESPGHSAVIPAPRGGNNWWEERANLLNQRVAETPDTQLLFIGDSITQGWEGAGKAVWEERYASHQAVNLGIGGDRTQHVLYRLQNGNLEGIAPKAAVVMIGTNNSNGYDNTARQIAEGIRAIVGTLRERVPNTKILLLGIFPRGENINEQRGKLLQINQILAKEHDGEQVHYLDIGHHFINENGWIPGDIMPDYLHLSPKGYEIWADAIAPHLRELMGSEESAGINEAMLGEWIFAIEGPEGEEVHLPLTLAQEDGKVTGSISSPDDRKFPVKEAEVEGNAIHFQVTRGDMTYVLEGALREGRLEGTVIAEVDGEEVKRPWKARRPTGGH